jgi:hypothetical protein
MINRAAGVEDSSPGIRSLEMGQSMRARVSVRWDKDRGENPDGSERINDRHPTLAERRASRAAAGKG